MKLGIIGNIAKENIETVIQSLIKKLIENNLNYMLCDSLQAVLKNSSEKFFALNTLASECDMLLSIGGDGTMLSTANTAHHFNKPVLGLNFGKLGFLAEVDISQFDSFINDLKTNNFAIEKRIVIVGECSTLKKEKLFAINDLVIDKGGWPKMIEITIHVDDEYVTTFSADGLIVATPTGSTGYSLSVGGPIVNPAADVFTLSPISPHSLTMRPLVLSSTQKIKVQVQSFHSKVLVNCDGQRVLEYKPPIELQITKSEKPLKLVRTSSTSYFNILRTKLLWGLDIRNKN